MDKYDLEQLAQKGKNKIDVTRTTINRKLRDLSFSNVFLKQIAIHCGVALLCVILLCVVVGSIASLSCKNDMTELLTSTTMDIIDLKSQELSLSQDAAQIARTSVNAMVEANDNGFVDDSVIALYNITEQKVEYYMSLGLYSKSDRLNDWYQEQTENPGAEPIFSLPASLKEFADRHAGKDLVITSVRLVNNVLTPEIVDARRGRNVIETWTENDGLDPNRLLYTGDCPVFIAGVEGDNPLVGVIASHKFNGEHSKVFVDYDKSDWPAHTQVESRAFTVNNVEYEAHFIYTYAGLSPLALYLFIASGLIFGVAIVVSITQTKKIREF